MSIKGIDVSEFQGKIDWEKVKATGIKYAILRCGYGIDTTNQDDSYFERNIEECERLGIPYGVYLFSYANTVEKAKSEAQHTLRLIKGHKLALGVWYDIEDNNTSGKASKETLTNIINTYCNTIKNAGYECGVYASVSWLDSKIEKQIKNAFPIWVAQYYSKCEYKEKYVLWQYTSDGKVDGISGRVDMNYLYDENLLNDTENKPTEKEDSKKSNKIDEDGLWGKETTKKAQKVFGTTVDGIVSNQYSRYKSDNPGLLSSTFEWEGNPGKNGSELIRAIQEWCGAKKDGYMGPDTIKLMQKKLGTYVDGYVSNPSSMVKVFQKWLNKQ